jgi:Replication-relaxation
MSTPPDSGVRARMSTPLHDGPLAALDARLSRRERAAISILLEMRFLSTAQLERWVFDGATPLARARASRRSVAKLVELGLIRHLERRIGGVRAGSAGHINVLTALGLRLAAAHGWITPEQAHRTREPGTQFVQHHLAVAEAHLRVLEARARGELELLARQAEPAAWREFTAPDGGQVTLKPDACFTIGPGTRSTHWFVEVDRATVGGSTLERKLSVYVDFSRSADFSRRGQARAARGAGVKVLWLVPDRRRLDQLQQAFGRTPAAARPLFRAAIFDQLVAVLANAKAPAHSQRQPAHQPARMPGREPVASGDPVASREAV